MLCSHYAMYLQGSRKPYMGNHVLQRECNACYISNDGPHRNSGKGCMGDNGVGVAAITCCLGIVLTLTALSYIETIDCVDALKFRVLIIQQVRVKSFDHMTCECKLAPRVYPFFISTFDDRVH
jgi:hypothetical protein